MGERPDKRDEAPPSCCAPVRPASGGLSRTPQSRVRNEEASVEGMIRLPGGTFLMGTNDGQGFPEDGEGPVRKVTLDTFLISPHATTNAEFSAFVEATGYETEAERFGWSFVFHRFI